MKGFTQDGSDLHYINYDEAALLPTLPPQIYLLNANMQGLFLTIDQPRFELPALYGNIETRATRILTTYKHRSKSTGILLTGDKGSGKTMLTKVIANQAIDNGLPVIIISKPFAGNQFDTLINGIGECVIIFDEFAKVYKNGDDDSQQALLTFLDGVTSSVKRLLLFTENNEYHINDFLLNRPGRILYHWRYEKLDETTIKEVLTATLTNQTHTDKVIMLSRTMSQFSFDTLTAIIEEANRYPDIELAELVEALNIPIPRYASYDLQINEITKDGKPATVIGSKTISENESFYFSYKDENGGENRRSMTLYDSWKIYEDTLTIVYKHDEHDIKVITQKVPSKLPDYSGYYNKGY